MSKPKRPSRPQRRQIKKTITTTVNLRQVQKKALRQRERRAIQTPQAISYRWGTAQSTYRLRNGIGYLEPKVAKFTVMPLKGTKDSVPIKAFNYDSQTATLLIHFWKNKIRTRNGVRRVISRTPGAKYIYFQVPFEVYSRLLAAGSKGRFFYYNIRNRYDHRGPL